MHMADALVTPIVAGSMYACSGAAMVYSIKKVNLNVDTKKIPLMGVMGEFVFAAQMINFTILGTGSSGHICGGMMLSAILGPYAAFLTMIGILLIQCLMFADGGMLALGCNIWNMSFYGCFIGGIIIWRYIMKNGISKKKIMIASVLGCILTLQLGAFSVSLETLASNITELPFITFIAAMQPIHLVIGLVEGMITGTVLIFIYESRPQILWMNDENLECENRVSYKNMITIIAVCAVVIGGLFSRTDSTNPDGLEWSIEKITGSTEVSSADSVYEKAEHIQESMAMFPDYSLKISDSNLGTSLSGIIGVVIVIIVCGVGGYVVKIFKRRIKYEQNK